jgi:hypothetical protein
MRNFVFILFLSTSTIVNAQNIEFQSDTIRFNSTSFQDLQTNVIANVDTYFVWFNDTKIEWNQKNGTVTYVLTVDSLSSSTLEDQNGAVVTAQVTMGDQINGTLSLQRVGSGIELTVNLTGGSVVVNIKYLISSYHSL